MFVPASDGGILLRKLEEVKDTLSKESSWRPKLVEKSGLPLLNIFRTRVPNINGCLLGNGCKICDGDAVKCSYKGVVYSADNDTSTVAIY